MKLKDLHPKEYRVWKAMRARCNAPCQRNSMYQKRGIKVCERWNSFDTFFNDMGECPEGCSIDRIDTYGNYEPANCRWATASIQAKNRGNFNRMISYNGETMCLKDWAKKLNIRYGTLYIRMLRHPEMSFEEAISYVCPKDKMFLWEGKYYTRKELCSMYNIPIMNFHDRTHKGWPLERILLTPVSYKI